MPTSMPDCQKWRKCSSAACPCNLVLDQNAMMVSSGNALCARSSSSISTVSCRTFANLLYIPRIVLLRRRCQNPNAASIWMMLSICNLFTNLTAATTQTKVYLLRNISCFFAVQPHHQQYLWQKNILVLWVSWTEPRTTPPSKVQLIVHLFLT